MKWHPYLCWIFQLCALSAGPFGSAAASATLRPAWAGVVTHVTDGDTLWVKADGATESTKIRLRGLDAPEICQHWGPQAQALLVDRALHQTARVQVYARDRYGRQIAQVLVGGEDLTAFMVREGGAWAETRVHGHGRYSDLQAQARSSQRGLWAQAKEPEHPAHFRQRHGPCHVSQPGHERDAKRTPGKRGHD
jgi:micrococcal nuclease